jgi:hypothetical protein
MFLLARLYLSANEGGKGLASGRKVVYREKEPRLLLEQEPGLARRV